MPKQNDQQPPPPNSPQDPKQPQQPPTFRIPTAYVIMIAFFIGWAIFLYLGYGTGDEHVQIPYSRFKKELKAENVASITNEGEGIRGELHEAVSGTGEDSDSFRYFKTTLPVFGDEKLMEELMAQDVVVESKGSGGSMLSIILINALPVLLLIGFFVYMGKRAGNRAQGLMGISRSKAKRFEKEKSSVTFDDVAGAEEAKKSLQEIIRFLREPSMYEDLGCRVPKGVLLVGPPGTGKTLLARAAAGEAGVPFFSISGSDFMEMFVGVGASRVRDLFTLAKRSAPCIVFVDELDSIGRHRGAGLGGGHDEREQTLNQLLSEIDGFEPVDQVVIVAATNRPDILDPALLRPGRFDRRITVDLPTQPERIEILKTHSKDVPLADDVELEQIARSMPGRSGADLSNLVNEAALVAARDERKEVTAADFAEARDRILMGAVRSSVVLQNAEKHAVAVHEAGHALVAHICPDADPVDKVSILPRGKALGATQQLPEERYNLTETYLRGRLKVMLGGRAAEETVLGNISSGAADDLQQATKLAHRMIASWGMGEIFSHAAFSNGNGDVFLGEQIAKQRNYSEHTAQQIDTEVNKLLNSCFDEAAGIIKENRNRLDALTDALEDAETIAGSDLENLLEGKTAEANIQPSK